MKGRRQQTRLNFSPLPSSSPATDRYSSSVKDRLATIRYESPGKRGGVIRSPVKAHGGLPTPANSSQQKPVEIEDSGPPDPLAESAFTPLPFHTTSSDEEDDDDIILPPSSKRRRITQKAQQPSDDEDADADEAEEGNDLPPSSDSISKPRTLRGRSTRRLRSDRAQQSSSSSQRMVAVEVISPHRPARRSTRASKQVQPRLSPDLSDEQDQETPEEKLGSAETSGDEDDAIVTKPTVKRRQQKAALPKDDFIVDDDEVEILSNDEEDVVPSGSRRRRASPTRSPKTPRKQTHQEKLDLEEDLEDLQDATVTHDRTRGTRVDSKKAERRRNLEILKRRRAGEKVSTVSEDSEDGHAGVMDEVLNESHYPAIDSSSDALGSQSSTEGPPPEDLDTYEADFIDFDEDETVGVPSEMPLEFTRHASKKPREHFKYVVEWMVNNKINPAFPRDDGMYALAFDKIDDEVKAQAGSKFISSAWNADFRRALEARPSLNERPYEGGWQGSGCDACNRTNHPASFALTFFNDAYNHKTLEPIENSDNEDDDNDDDSKSVDSRGRSIPPRDREFYVGRFCKANAVMAHTLCHWRHHLNTWILDFLKAQEVTTPDKIVERADWTQKKKTRYANEVVDRMEASGEIGNLWKDFKANQDAAREEKPNSRWAKRSGGRATQAVRL